MCHQPFNGHVKTAQQQTIMQKYGDWYMVVDVWAATFGTARCGLGGLHSAQSSATVPNVTAHPSTASVPTTHFNFTATPRPSTVGASVVFV